MAIQRLGRGECLALAGSILLLLTMFGDWFDVAPERSRLARDEARRVVEFAGAEVQRSGWSSLGWLVTLLVALAILACAFWLFALLAPDTPRLPFQPDEVTLFAAALAAIALTARVVFQPGLGAGLTDAQVELTPLAFVGPACALLIAAGAWRAISDAPAGVRRAS